VAQGSSTARRSPSFVDKGCLGPTEMGAGRSKDQRRSLLSTRLRTYLLAPAESVKAIGCLRCVQCPLMAQSGPSLSADVGC
jgi:hypothetical protein